MKDDKPEVYARFRLSVDNGFRNEFSYVDYRRWGVVQSWTGGRFSNEPPPRQDPSQCIEVWFNWARVGTHASYDSAEAQIALLLRQAPAPLGELKDYLNIRPRSA